MAIQLDPRLFTVAGLVRKGCTVADIGTDHGQLVCYLLQSGICVRAFACDVNSAPLQVAKKNVTKHGLCHKVEFVLTDGLTGLDKNLVDDVVIAGMGGDLIWKILSSADWTRCGDKRFILQPMTKHHVLRTLLYAGGFAIESETPVRCGRFVYTAMLVKYTGVCADITPLFSYCGKVWDNTDKHSLEYLDIVAKRLHKKAIGTTTQEYNQLAGQIEARIAKENTTCS